MQSHNIWTALSAALIAITPTIVPAAAQVPLALTGQVTSAAEGAMEGVLVSARKDGSTVTITVASDNAGRFGFAAAKLAPGRYTLAVRAVGYELSGGKSIDVSADKVSTLDLALRPTKNLPKQLTNAEWLASLPGTETQKKALLNCIGCHDLDRIVSSAYNAEQFVEVIERMTGYYPGSTPQHPQRLIGEARRNLGPAAGVKALAEYLASINLSKDEVWDYPLKTLPRPSGRATRVVITEYDLPRKQIQPHDVIVNSEGMVWFSHFGEQFLGRLDPKTGEVSQFQLPVIKPGYPLGTLDLETDKAGNLWIAMMYQGGVAKFDKQDANLPGLEGPGRVADRCDAAGLRKPDQLRCGRQGLGQELGSGADPAARPAHRPVGKSRLVQGPCEQSNHHFLRHPRGSREQSLSARLLLLEYRQARCEDRQADGVPVSHPQFAAAARAGG